MRKTNFKISLILILTGLFFGWQNVFSQSDVYVSSQKPLQANTLFIKTQKEPVSASFGADKINFFKPTDAEEWVGIFGIDAKKKTGNYNLAIKFKDGSEFKKQITVLKRQFQKTKLGITEELKAKGYTLQGAVSRALNKENVDIYEVFKTITPTAYFKKPFAYPLKKIESVGDYGNLRDSGGVVVQHLGVDLAAEVGTQVFASNDGAVCFLEDLPTYGKTLIIDHGLGIFSLYLHLNEFKVGKGDHVKQGDIIGLSGNTGYSLGPHLHFSIKLGDNSVDPLKFIETVKQGIEKKISSEVKGEGPKNISIIDRLVNWGFQKVSGMRQIDTVVVHSSYDALGSDPYDIEGLIKEYKLYKVSPHYVIDRQGQIYRLVQDNNIAFQAGVSQMPDGRKNANGFSIGIELLYYKTDSPSEKQYAALTGLINELKQKYKINYIVGHNEIAPSRRTDPWNIDWRKVR